MNVRESLRLSWRAIRSHKLRSTLTTLGVVIGIAAVVTFVTLGASLQADIIGQVGGEEASTIFGWAGPEGDDGAPGPGAEPVFSARDVAAIGDLPDVERAVPYTVAVSERFGYRNDTVARRLALRLTEPAYLDGAAFRDGRNFAPGSTEAVLTPAAAGMWGENVSVGEAITVTHGGETTELTVVGILNDSESRSPFEGFQGGPRIYTSPAAVGEENFLFFLAEATGPAAVESARASIRSYLGNASDARTSLPADYAFELQTSEDLLDQIRELLDLLTGFVTGIALISLVVGSIGIANIMLVSVTERTREIGIMKAVGAQRRDILGLFLVEATILGVLGAIGGLLLGGVVGFVATELIDIEAYVFPVEWAGIAVAVGVLVGVAAGLYPAWNAARTDPIDALRYE